ncbi:putative RNA-directed DNA polymerase from transposon X-element [Trichonephila clavipes]|nr:putative RNA-directed DNA polymerase from transposon X-element [Trichonephila clavipes]
MAYSIAGSHSDPHPKTWKRSKKPSQLSTDSTDALPLQDTRTNGQCPSHLTVRKEPMHSSVSEWLPCKGSSTLDNIIMLESKIRNAFVRRNHLFSIFFYIEKAYDRTWCYGLFRTLFNFGVRGNLATFI